MTARGWVIAGIVAACVPLAPLLFAPTLAVLNVTLMKVDLLAFGRGFTTLPLVQHEVVDRFGCVITKEFIDGIALGQATPGPIVITATFVGYKAGGLFEALMGTISVFFPPFLVVTTLAPWYERITSLRAVRVMVRGVLAAFPGMLLLVAYRFGQEALQGWVLMAAAWVALAKKADLLVIIGVGVAVSLFLFWRAAPNGPSADGYARGRRGGGPDPNLGAPPASSPSSCINRPTNRLPNHQRPSAHVRFP